MIILLSVSFILWLIFGCNNNQVVTVEIGKENVNVINILEASPGDTVLLEEHYLEHWGNQIIPDPLGHVMRFSYKIDGSASYRMVTKEEIKKNSSREQGWILQGVSDSLIKTGLYEVSYPTLIEIRSIKKGVVKKYRRAKSWKNE